MDLSVTLGDLCYKRICFQYVSDKEKIDGVGVWKECGVSGIGAVEQVRGVLPVGRMYNAGDGEYV